MVLKRRILLLIYSIFLAFVAAAPAGAAEIIWTNNAGGNWQVAANWNPNQIPGPDDAVIITNAGNYTVILDANASVGSLLLGGAEGGQAITISGSTLSLNGPTRITGNGLVAMTAAMVGGSGDLVVEGVLNIFGGSFSGSQPVVVTASGQMLIGGVANFGGRSIHNSGRLVWTSGSISNVSSVVNLPGGIIDALVNDSALAGTQIFTNAGTLRRSVGTNTVTFDIPFHNGGVAQIQSGRLLLKDLLHTGTFNIAENATLHLGFNRPADFSTASSVTGAGHVILNARADIRGTFHVGGSNIFAGGTVNLFAGYALSNAPLSVLAGTVSFNSGRTLSASTLTLGGGTLSGSDSLIVTGKVRGEGIATLQNTGRIDAYGGFTITPGAGLIMLSGTFNNRAFSVLTSVIYLENSAVLNNFAEGTIHYSGGGAFIGSRTGAAQGRFNNYGLFLKSSVSYLWIEVPCYNDGEFDIQGGGLLIAAGGTHRGTFRVGPGAGLAFSGAPHTLLSSSQIIGAGNVAFGTSVDVQGSLSVGGDVGITAGTNYFRGSYSNGGTLTVSGGVANFSTGSPVLPGSLTISGGVVSGTDPITVGRSMTWTGGGLSGAAAIHAVGGLTINGGTLLIDGRTLNNRGVANWNGGFIFTGGGSVISNAASGVFNINFDGQTFAGFGGSRRFINAGVLRKSSGTGTAVISDAFYNSGNVESLSGELAFGNVFTQTAGSTLLNGGNLGASGPLQIDGGVLAGNGRVSATVVNSGRVVPGGSSLLLRILGNYTQTSSGHLDIELGGSGSGFDQLQIQGIASLAGTLNVSSINSFRPGIGDTFQVLTFASRTGDFAAFNDSTGSDLHRIYDGNSLTLVASNGAPVLSISRPSGLAPMTQPAGLILTWSEGAAGYLLQSATNLSSSTWATVPSSGTNRVVVPATAPQHFFRLIKP